MKTAMSFSEKVSDLKNNRYDEIHRSAAKIFNEKGYQVTTMREIAHSLNLTIGTLYHYIQSKEDILFEICNRLTDKFLEDLREKLKRQTSGEDEIRIIIRLMLTNTVSHKDSVSVFLKEHRYLSAERMSIIYRKRKEIEGIVEEVIKKRIKNGELIASDSKIITLCLFGMCNWVAYWYRPNGMLPIDDITNIFYDIFATGAYSPNMQRKVHDRRSDEVWRLRKENRILRGFLEDLSVKLATIESDMKKDESKVTE